MGSFIILLLLTLLVGIFPLSIYLVKTLKSPTKSPHTLDSDLIKEQSASSNQQWWEDQRSRYNTGLVYAGLIAFGLYLSSFFSLIKPLSVISIQDLFSFLFIVVSYLIYMGVANLFYNLGAISETLIKPTNLLSFRKRMFNFAYWVAFIIPFLALIKAWINLRIF